MKELIAHILSEKWSYNILLLDDINQNIRSFISVVKYDKTLPTFCCLLHWSSILKKCAAEES